MILLSVLFNMYSVGSTIVIGAVRLATRELVGGMLTVREDMLGYRTSGVQVIVLDLLKV